MRFGGLGFRVVEGLDRIYAVHTATSLLRHARFVIVPLRAGKWHGLGLGRYGFGPGKLRQKECLEGRRIVVGQLISQFLLAGSRGLS